MEAEPGKWTATSSGAPNGVSTSLTPYEDSVLEFAQVQVLQLIELFQQDDELLQRLMQSGEEILADFRRNGDGTNGQVGRNAETAGDTEHQNVLSTASNGAEAPASPTVGIVAPESTPADHGPEFSRLAADTPSAGTPGGGTSAASPSKGPASGGRGQSSSSAIVPGVGSSSSLSNSSSTTKDALPDTARQALQVPAVVPRGLSSRSNSRTNNITPAIGGVADTTPRMVSNQMLNMLPGADDRRQSRSFFLNADGHVAEADPTVDAPAIGGPGSAPNAVGGVPSVLSISGEHAGLGGPQAGNGAASSSTKIGGGGSASATPSVFATKGEAGGKLGRIVLDPLTTYTPQPRVSKSKFKDGQVDSFLSHEPGSAGSIDSNSGARRTQSSSSGSADGSLEALTAPSSDTTEANGGIMQAITVLPATANYTETAVVEKAGNPNLSSKDVPEPTSSETLGTERERVFSGLSGVSSTVAFSAARSRGVIASPGGPGSVAERLLGRASGSGSDHTRINGFQPCSGMSRLASLPEPGDQGQAGFGTNGEAAEGHHIWRGYLLYALWCVSRDDLRAVQKILRARFLSIEDVALLLEAASRYESTACLAQFTELFASGDSEHRSTLVRSRKNPIPQPVPMNLDPNSTWEGELYHDRFVVIMVGLPARGKTYLSRRLARYLDFFHGVTTKIFNVGEYRRKMCGRHLDPSFFNPQRPENVAARHAACEKAMLDLIHWMCQDSGKRVAFFDATNSTPERREWVMSQVRRHIVAVKVMFLESVVTDDSIVERNIKAVKLKCPDFQEVSAQTAHKEFRERIEFYEEVYTTLDESNKLPEGNEMWVKVLNLSRHIVNNIKGYIPTKMVQFLMHLNVDQVQGRVFYLSRHGQSEYNELQKIGGDSGLTELGDEYAKALGEFATSYIAKDKDGRDVPARLWTSTLRRTRDTAGYIPQDLKVKNAKTGASVWEQFKKKEWRNLDEIYAGLYDGMTYREIEEQFPDEFRERQRNKLGYRYPRGESYLDVIGRVEACILDMERCRERLLVIGHQGVLRILYAYWKGLSREEAPGVSIPLNTVVQLIPSTYGCDEDRYRLLTCVSRPVVVDESHQLSRGAAESQNDGENQNEAAGEVAPITETAAVEAATPEGPKGGSLASFRGINSDEPAALPKQNSSGDLIQSKTSGGSRRYYEYVVVRVQHGADSGTPIAAGGAGEAAKPGAGDAVSSGRPSVQINDSSTPTMQDHAAPMGSRSPSVSGSGSQYDALDGLRSLSRSSNLRKIAAAMASVAAEVDGPVGAKVDEQGLPARALSTKLVSASTSSELSNLFTDMDLLDPPSH
ncbi:unnamed protein product [Amoebophrya sp. A25]|nr:unnamed protein product [Amoebophrya sp. A25]|eukprot:GSA25T00007588001.1